MRERSASFCDFADHRGGARFALRIGGADALRQRGGVQRLQSNARRTCACTSLRACGGRRGGVPQHERVAVVFQQQLVAAREGVGQRVAHGHYWPSGAGITFGAGTGADVAGAVAGCSGRRAGGSTGAGVDRHHDAGRRLRRLLLAAHEVVAVQRQGVAVGGVAHHDGAQEHHQVGLLAAARFALEQVAEDGHVAQHRHLLLVAGVFVLQQAAQHDDGAVVHQHAGLDRALVGDEARWRS